MPDEESAILPAAQAPAFADEEDLETPGEPRARPVRLEPPRLAVSQTSSKRLLHDAMRRSVDTFSTEDGRTGDPKQYVKTWHEDDNVAGQAMKAQVIILRTRGCSWLHSSGCTMCGYFTDSFFAEVTADDLVTQFDAALAQNRGTDLVKIYTSGSFFDPQEVAPDARRYILERAGAKTGALSVECTPEFLKPDVVRDAVRAVGKLEVGLGLESSSLRVLTHSVNKGYRLQEFAKAAKTMHDAKGLVKTYLLFKPPFLSEREAMRDLVASIRDVAPHSDTMSVNPVNVQKHTLVERLYHRKLYRPGWLWSLVEALREADGWLRAQERRPHLKCYPVGAGKPRGVHNCMTCDPQFVDLVERFSTSGDGAFLDAAAEIGCACKATWRRAVEAEPFLAGGTLGR